MSARAGVRRAVALGAFACALMLFALSGGLAWAQSGAKTVAGEVPAPVAQGKAHSRGAHASNATLSLNVDLAVRESAKLDGVIAAASTPGSPNYGHYLSEAEYMATYAPTGAQVAAVESWLASQGLQVTGSSHDNLLVHVQGSTAAVEQAFGVAVNDYEAEGKTFFANESQPSVPADLAVQAVSGLSNYVKFVASKACVEAKCGYTGLDFRAAYNVSGTAEGETIAYTLWGKALTSSTLKKYAEISGTTELTIGPGNEQIEFFELGGPSAVNETTEIALDVESAHVVAPKAHHLYYLAHEPNTTSIESALNEAANSKAKVISNSWGSEQTPTCAGFTVPGLETILQKGASLGKTFFFASGDWGAPHGCQYPTSSQYVLSVGGTSLEVGVGSEWKKETAIANGGNCNNGVSRPSWQTGIGTPVAYPSSSCSGRAYPDVSAISCGSKETGTAGECFLESNEGSNFLEGGTSLAAPVWTAAAAVWNHNNAGAGRPGVGFLPPLIYSLANDPVAYGRDFHDMTEGTNGFPATKGWDEASGWGSANVGNLRSNEAELAYTGPTSASTEQSVTLSAKLTDKGTSQGIQGRTVHFEVGAESCEGSTNASGVASCGVVIKDAAGKYTLKAQFAPDAAYLEASTSTTFTVEDTTPPVFGRCLKTAVPNGNFKNSACTEKLATPTGKFEWSPGPGPKTGFTLAIKPLTTIKLESPGKKSLLCTGASGHGHITGTKTVNFELIAFTGCSDGGEKCTSTGVEGEVVFSGFSGSLTGSLGWSNKALKKLDLDLTGSSGFVFSAYRCPNIPSPNKEVLLGTTGILLPVTINKFSTKATDKWSQSKGKQVPSALEGGPTLAFEWDRINISPFTETIESVGLAATLLQTYEEGYEINTLF
jgi:kumamolisin